MAATLVPIRRNPVATEGTKTVVAGSARSIGSRRKHGGNANRPNSKNAKFWNAKDRSAKRWHDKNENDKNANNKNANDRNASDKNANDKNGLGKKANGKNASTKNGLDDKNVNGKSGLDWKPKEEHNAKNANAMKLTSSGTTRCWNRLVLIRGRTTVRTTRASLP